MRPQRQPGARGRRRRSSGPRAARRYPAVTIGGRTSLGSMALFRSRAEQKVADAGYDPARLPPGQYLTEKWPVLHAGSVPHVDLATWDFTVTGEVERPVRLSWDELTTLPAT